MRIGDVVSSAKVLSGQPALSLSERWQRAPSADLEADARTVSKPINRGIAKVFKKYPIKGK